MRARVTIVLGDQLMEMMANSAIERTIAENEK